MDNINNKPDLLEELQKIRERTETEIISSKLKKNPLGGYSIKSVDDYIEILKNQLEQQSYSYKNQIRDILFEKEKTQSECSVLSKQLEESSEKIANLQEKINFTHDSDIKYETKIKELYDEINELNKYTGENEEVESLKKQIEELNNYCENLEIQIDNNNKLIDDSVLNNKNEEVESLKKQIEELNNYCVTLESKVNNEVLINENKSELIDKYENLKNVLAQMLEEKEVLTQEINKSKVDVKEFEQLKNENQSLQFEVLTSGMTINDLLSQVDKLNNVSKNTLKQLDFEKEKAKIAFEEKAKLQIRISSYFETIDSLKCKIELLESQVSILTRQLDDSNKKNRILSGLVSDEESYNTTTNLQDDSEVSQENIIVPILSIKNSN